MDGMFERRGAALPGAWLALALACSAGVASADQGAPAHPPKDVQELRARAAACVKAAPSLGAVILCMKADGEAFAALPREPRAPGSL